MGKVIQLSNVVKKYGDSLILAGIDLTIKAGERIVLLGPSGSGKSTLLRMIAGLEEITDGELFLDGKFANQISCGERDMAMVFQNYALYPHMSVSENITFALRSNRLDKREIETRLNEALDILDLKPYQKRLPKELSGGQRQRVALARAIVKRSDYFLLDEPLSNLDVRLRLDARMELVKIHEMYQQTFVYVTHDQIEAMTMAHRIVLLNEGTIQMVDTPRNVYLRPTNVFSATFIGAPGMNILEAHIRSNELIVGDQFFTLKEEWRKFLLEKGEFHLFFGIRPEHFTLVNHGGDLQGKIVYRELLGQNYALTIELGESTIIALSEESHWKIGDTAHLLIDQKNCHFFSKSNQINMGYPFTLEEGESTNEIFASI